MANLTLTDTSIKLGELNLDKSQFDLPKQVVILSARLSYQYREVNQVLRKLVKLHNLVNVNLKELLYLQRAPFLVFFFIFLY